VAKLKLTKSAVDAAQPQAQAVELRDTLVPGFLCKVTPAGRKVFMLQYRTNAGERRKPALGLYGELTVEQARSLAQEWLAQVRRGLLGIDGRDVRHGLADRADLVVERIGDRQPGRGESALDLLAFGVGDRVKGVRDCQIQQVVVECLIHRSTLTARPGNCAGRADRRASGI
jgi:hypothetical protein